ncbi:hypothetical protein SAMN05421747_106192 [Parapedobacter composti]|uniref:Uncharacterized protein n=1 Tax=Parapedobacter composti TaxID=623281 RepID=A0A1I1HGY5_9SPHI|nr:hypothetical protein [Parapedobacter composti]SFC23429.1 hypothetical protein SAMN05421747_106192 [Parapedobacter composti]
MPSPPIYLRAGALLLALLVATVIAAITAALLLVFQYHRQYAAETMRHERLRQNLASATNLLLVGETANGIDTARLGLFDDQRDSVLLIRAPWGIYDIGIARAFEGHDTLSHVFLMGKALTPGERYALYLADEHRPLSLSGKTRIQGDAFLPEAGIRKAYIENQAYAYEEVIHGGTMRHSTTSLPPLDAAVLERLTRYLLPESAAEWRGDALDWLVLGDTLTQPFFARPLLLHSIDSMTVTMSLAGNIVLVADSAITVTADAALDQVLLFAPSIRFADNFRGRVQAFARDSIIVGRDCAFGYPSALGVVHIPKDSLVFEFQPLLRIDSASVVHGLVFSHFPGSDQYFAKVALAEGAVVKGQVYADGLLELQGAVHGVTLCRRFTLQTPSSLYENFVLGGVMDETRLSPYYTGSALLNTGRLSNVLAWLNDL